jgi:chromosome segregation ATPase
MHTEAKIHADVETLRQSISETQELYREVCTLLFFRYGITPTANKLYQYVRKGSMSAPAEALAKFWEDLREKSRVRIEHPDLPDSLKSAAGDLVVALWTQAHTAAQEGLAAFRSEAQESILEARAAQISAENERAAALLELQQTIQDIQAATERALTLERELATEQGGRAALVTQLEAAGRQQAALETALADARRDFAVELEKLRQALQKSEDRCEAAEKRALLEIERERTAAAKAQKEVDHARQYQQDAEQRHRTEMAQILVDLGAARQNVGVAEGMLHEMRSQCQHQADELQLLRATVAEGETRKSMLERDLTASWDNLAKVEKELQQWKPAPTSEHAPAKSRKSTRRTAT